MGQSDLSLSCWPPLVWQAARDSHNEAAVRMQLKLPGLLALAQHSMHCFLLTWALLLQVGQPAEQRSLLRAGRAGEAMPLITLPESLLLQSGSNEQQHAEASAHEHYSAGLWRTVVEDAREAFFRGEEAATTTTAAPAVPATTQDPEVLAKQLGITKDAAQARNLLVAMITRAQTGLISRLHDINMDLDAMALRAKMDLKAVNHSAEIAENMPIMASNSEVDIEKVEENGGMLQNKTLPEILQRSKDQVAQITELVKDKKPVESDVDAAKNLPSAETRIQDNAQTMDTIVPRLELLDRKVMKLENRLYDGDLKKLVDETTGKEVQNIMEDVSRGFGRFIQNAKSDKKAQRVAAPVLMPGSPAPAGAWDWQPIQTPTQSP